MAGNRKDALRSLFAGGPLKPADIMPVPHDGADARSETSQHHDAGLTAVNPSTDKSVGLPPRTASGAVKAMGLSLGAMTREAEEAKQLRQALAEGERVVMLDPQLIDGSFVTDRLADGESGDPDFEALVKSLDESGQQVPILVRPHPMSQGRFQTAYGHRRLAALKRLGRKVKAIVRPLTDDELVLAQGKENAERRNLSFIERAVFAKTLVQRGFARKLAGDALGIDKTELSRLIQVAESVPDALARAIGPAPKAGRNRWMALAARLGDEQACQQALEAAESEAVRQLDSDGRFAAVFRALDEQTESDGAGEALTDRAGRTMARLSRGRTLRIAFATSVPAAQLAEITDAIAVLVAERLKQG
ncbi:plasmid partitioning protein RepB [Xaviernesmea oryzae]|uniref:Plasmid partitioning protein RepB n=1 Tax=Xaviernesmea oryzae TaxID=464029 RepID=A0A1Q9B1D7_9HYPH|nr:plasmid partitioning protein RepB [Xaviernesmea oryzae]OLP61812.1 plasmid partitioning protein RepB [Xaviernesmea oryzae]SEL76666.1 chromosome partitioning protein, ParB family [Xaviernesmea oryzae]